MPVLCILVNCKIAKALLFHFATNEGMEAITKALNMTSSSENVMHVFTPDFSSFALPVRSSP